MSRSAPANAAVRCSSQMMYAFPVSWRMINFVLTVTCEENVILRPPGAKFGTRLMQISNHMSLRFLVSFANKVLYGRDLR